MNTIQLEKLMRRNFVVKNFFKGCFASDKIPTYTSYPHCFIVNTDPSYMEGEHWVGINVISPNFIEFYDSFGVYPPKSLHIKNYLENYKEIFYNNVQLQSYKSEACG